VGERTIGVDRSVVSPTGKAKLVDSSAMERPKVPDCRNEKMRTIFKETLAGFPMKCTLMEN
jgi:hypothetical protein